MEIGICSFSFHRLLAAGEQDIFRFITDCKDLGCTQLDPWNKHFPALADGDWDGRLDSLTSEERSHLDEVKAAANAVELPFGCIAVDDAHIWDEDRDRMAGNRKRAFRWLEAAHVLGAKQVRIDSGGPANPTEEQWAQIFSGYEEVLSRAKALGLQVLVENHWGPTTNPDHVLHLLDQVPDLGLLFDTNNWLVDRREDAWERVSDRASALHVKTFVFDESGNETSADQDVAKAIRIVHEKGYRGAWGVESVPHDGDERRAAAQTIALIQRLVNA